MAASPVVAVEATRAINRDGAANPTPPRVAFGARPSLAHDVAIVGLFVLAVLYTLYVARASSCCPSS